MRVLNCAVIGIAGLVLLGLTNIAWSNPWQQKNPVGRDVGMTENNANDVQANFDGGETLTTDIQAGHNNQGGITGNNSPLHSNNIDTKNDNSVNTFMDQTDNSQDKMTLSATGGMIPVSDGVLSGQTSAGQPNLASSGGSSTITNVGNNTSGAIQINSMDGSGNVGINVIAVFRPGS